MQLAKVVGHATSSIGHPSLRGCRLLLCQPVNEDGAACGTPQLVIDSLGAGMHQSVVFTTDGSAVQDYVKDEHSPLRNFVLAIRDEQEKGASA